MMKKTRKPAKCQMDEGADPKSATLPLGSRSHSEDGHHRDMSSGEDEGGYSTIPLYVNDSTYSEVGDGMLKQVGDR